MPSVRDCRLPIRQFCMRQFCICKLSLMVTERCHIPSTSRLRNNTHHEIVHSICNRDHVRCIDCSPRCLTPYGNHRNDIWTPVHTTTLKCSTIHIGASGPYFATHAIQLGSSEKFLIAFLPLQASRINLCDFAHYGKLSHNGATKRSHSKRCIEVVRVGTNGTLLSTSVSSYPG